MKFNISLLDILSSKTKVKIIRFLLTHEASMSEREIASVLKVSHMSINRTMQELFQVNFVNFVNIGKAHLWKVNRKSYAFKTLSGLIKGMYEISSPVDDLKEMLFRNLPKKTIKKAILFGSISKGLEKVDSDIDLLLLVKDKESKDKIEPLLEKLSQFCLESYGNRLSPYLLTEDEMRHKKNLPIITEINKGIPVFPKEKVLR